MIKLLNILKDVRRMKRMVVNEFLTMLIHHIWYFY